jgi:mono/diheme cytochrome c family protein
MLVGAVAASAAQKPPAKPPPNAAAKPLTTDSGVYTAAQAARGEQTYMNLCVSCHPAGTYAQQAFRDKWNGATVSLLYEFVSNTMPKNDPGSLEPEEYAQVIAYVLKTNGAPAGKSPLPADSAALKKIRLYLPRR